VVLVIAIPIDWTAASRAVGAGVADPAWDGPAADGRGEAAAAARTGAADAGPVDSARTVLRTRSSEATGDRGRLLGAGLIAAGCLVLLWIGVLAAQTPLLAEPANWNAAWIGLDVLEAAGLLTTGLLLRRQDPRMGLAAAATAMLLFMDAWFDVMTAAPSERLLSIAMAAVAELPIGAVCARLALRRTGNTAP